MVSNRSPLPSVKDVTADSLVVILVLAVAGKLVVSIKLEVSSNEVVLVDMVVASIVEITTSSVTLLLLVTSSVKPVVTLLVDESTDEKVVISSISAEVIIDSVVKALVVVSEIIVEKKKSPLLSVASSVDRFVTESVEMSVAKVVISNMVVFSLTVTGSVKVVKVISSALAVVSVAELVDGSEVVLANEAVVFIRSVVEALSVFVSATVVLSSTAVIKMVVEISGLSVGCISDEVESNAVVNNKVVSESLSVVVGKVSPLLSMISVVGKPVKVFDVVDSMVTVTVVSLSVCSLTIGDVTLSIVTLLVLSSEGSVDIPLLSMSSCVVTLTKVVAVVDGGLVKSMSLVVSMDGAEVKSPDPPPDASLKLSPMKLVVVGSVVSSSNKSMISVVEAFVFEVLLLTPGEKVCGLRSKKTKVK